MVRRKGRNGRRLLSGHRPVESGADGQPPFEGNLPGGLRVRRVSGPFLLAGWGAEARAPAPVDLRKSGTAGVPEINLRRVHQTPAATDLRQFYCRPAG